MGVARQPWPCAVISGGRMAAGHDAPCYDQVMGYGRKVSIPVVTVKHLTGSVGFRLHHWTDNRFVGLWVWGFTR